MRTFRTVLEQQIRERRMTFEEFVDFAERFAREHNEPGTLSVRHLQRLTAGRRSDGRPLGPVQPATARLLEHIFGLRIDELLAPPSPSPHADNWTAELRQMLAVSGRIDGPVISELQRQFASIRRLDRQLGAIVAHDELLAKVSQVAGLLAHSMPGRVREQLAALLSELCCLAGWQALDMGNVAESWRHYDRANSAALESGMLEFKALAEAGRAFVLIDVGETRLAVDLLASTRNAADRKCANLFRSWLSAAYGEMLAADGRRDESFRAFDKAAVMLPSDGVGPDGPYVALDAVHLARWRGSAMAQSADANAVEVLNSALDRLDRTFTRAETALRVDLAIALAAIDEPVPAREQAERAGRMAAKIGSVRQQRRVRALKVKIE